MPKVVKLRDIGLEAAYLESREERTVFRNSVRHVCAHYGRHLPVVETLGIWKVLIECLDPADESQAPREALGVAVVQARVPFAEYAAASVQGRKSVALETTHRGALHAASYYGWPLAPFETAYAGVIADDFHNVWTWKKTKRHRKSGLSAELRCEHEHDAFRAWLVAKDLEGRVLGEKQVIQDLPSEFVFVPLLGKLNWVTEATVALISKAGDEVGRLDVGD